MSFGTVSAMVKRADQIQCFGVGRIGVSEFGVIIEPVAFVKERSG
jgi:hypothetical protein